MLRVLYSSLLIFLSTLFCAQLPLARDTIKVIENGLVLKMPWANGLNYINASQTDINFDGKKDLVFFDRAGSNGKGRFRCFVNIGIAGEVKYIADPGLSYYFPICTDWAVLKDYNCDGKEDLFCSTSSGIKIYKNIGSAQTGPKFALEQSLLESNYNPTGVANMVNLYASSVGVPGIADVDGDGDLDILTFAPQGIIIEYHKNRSKEKYGHCDSLDYEISEYCWGNISESNCSVNLNACSSAKSTAPFNSQNSNKPYHAGSCLLCLDSDDDGDKDLVMGDIVCNTLQYVHNTGSSTNALFTDTTKRYPNYPNKNNTLQVKIDNFPCAYSADVNNDGKLDLLASPNAPNSENFESVWYYQNVSSTNTVNFQFVRKNLFQNEMIDVGQNAYPVLFDYNADGKKDLLIGTHGYYINNSLSARLTLYQNVGTNAVPSFSLVSRDYANLSSKNLNFVMPTVGDIDGDGDIDICVGNSTGQIHWLENTAGAGNPCNFSIFKLNPFSFTTPSGTGSPQLFDLDNDGKLDLLIGMRNGRIAFYKNTATTVSTPSFSLMNSFLGSVDVKDASNIYGTDGYAAPHFYKDGTELKLLVGSINGRVFQYSVPNNLSSTFPLINNSVNAYNEGEQSTVWYEDINADGKPDLFIGNASGGLSFFSSNSPFVGLSKDTKYIHSPLQVFPNPNNGVVNMEILNEGENIQNVSIYSTLGNLVLKNDFFNNKIQMDLSALETGIYFAKITISRTNGNSIFTYKLVKQ